MLSQAWRVVWPSALTIVLLLWAVGMAVVIAFVHGARRGEPSRVLRESTERARAEAEAAELVRGLEQRRQQGA